MKIIYSILQEKKNIIFIAILCIGCFLRLYKLDFQSFWYEELMTLNYAKGDSLVDFFHRYHQIPDASPPLYSLFVHFLISLKLDSDWILRLPSALFGLGTIVMSYLLGKKLSSKTAGLLTALFCSLSGTLVYYSQELRYNSALVFFILTISYLFLDFNEGKLGKLNKVLMVLNVIILTSLHYLGILYIFELVFFASLLRIKDFRFQLKLIGILLCVGIIFFPWFQTFWKQLSSWSIIKPINNSPNLFNYFNSMFDFSFFYQTYWEKKGLSEGNVIYYIKFFFYLFLSLCSILYLKKFWKEKSQFFKMTSLSKIVLWVTFSGNVLLFFLLDLIGTKKYFYEKNLLFTLPFLYLLFAHVITNLFSEKECIIVGLVTSLLIIYRPYIVQNYYGAVTKTEFRQTAELISKDAHQRPVFVMCGDKRWYEYYFLKYKISNYTFVKNIKEFHSLINKENEAWIMFAHCFMDVEIENELGKYRVLQAYRSSSLAFARLYQFNQVNSPD